LRRRGTTRAQMHRLRDAYRALFLVEGRISDRIDAVEREFAGDPLVDRVIAFIRAGGKRPLMRPRAGRWNDTRGGGSGSGDDTA
jgi:UDP-N-acetylglucosamine acyltransferase